jgi:hypothetical protein
MINNQNLVISAMTGMKRLDRALKGGKNVNINGSWPLNALPDIHWPLFDNLESMIEV